MSYSILGTVFGQLLASPSFLRSGFFVRSAFWNKKDLEVDLNGQIHMITGANSGIGFAAAEELAKRGAEVHLVCRSKERGDEAVQHITTSTKNDKVHLHVVDLSLTKDVTRFANQFVNETPKLDVLVNNAGYMPLKYEETSEGIEKSFATNVLSGFLLTELLEPALARSPAARVINVTSGGMYTQKLDVDDLQSKKESKKDTFDGVRVYAQQKRAQMLLTERFAEKWKHKKIVVNAMHPGWVNTPSLKNLFAQAPQYGSLAWAFRTPQEGADTIVWMAVSETAGKKTGKLFFDRKERSTHIFGAQTHSSPADVDRLWSQCRSLSGLPALEEEDKDSAE
mmetsp:Transcript_28291/g.45828  ORF Transcript_28291/g.45828 Transcript_28291/m.45828 type:complete len:338 (-) Transcript_28291:1025-2038(-)|eukprot:CAMPEP_0184649912 /NCGR_PEP_ID=MMETSP0308-20130426/7361_1 /TAXON_ID=38269 /ORGANISM="Gloeochaete witrockiana, Strain SAG 46.84" /LENGTH=337 /DNA_ID=CAMNT_0027083027 /DNA_START=167 /DNA_END=1180 /DNA_ORIENTATION=-